jgi:hypothetical protein
VTVYSFLTIHLSGVYITHRDGNSRKQKNKRKKRDNALDELLLFEVSLCVCACVPVCFRAHVYAAKFMKECVAPAVLGTEDEHPLVNSRGQRKKKARQKHVQDEQ